MKLKLFYRLGKELHFAEDEKGNAAESYICIEFEEKLEKATKEFYKKIQEKVRYELSKKANVDLKHIIPITSQEYFKKI